MARTAVGLFENQGLAYQVAEELKTAGLPSGWIRTIANPLDLPVEGSLGTPHTDFMAALCRDLREIGMTDEEANVYVKGVDNGGVLVMATGTAEQIDSAASIMNRHRATDVEKLAGLEPVLPAPRLSIDGASRDSVPTGRTRQSGGGARIFVW